VSSSIQQMITGSILLVMIIVDRVQAGRLRLLGLGRSPWWTRWARREGKG
jgi:hypothetical protein